MLFEEKSSAVHYMRSFARSFALDVVQQKAEVGFVSFVE